MRKPDCPSMTWNCRWGLVAILVLSLIGSLFTGGISASTTAAASELTLTPDQVSGQLVGTTITWTASLANASSTTEYRFSVDNFVVRDFATRPSFTWTPLDEGNHAVMVEARDGARDVNTTGAYTIVSRVTANAPVISATTHPLVALYSIPPCITGTVQVFFAIAGAQNYQHTPPAQCSAVSTNVYLVGMQATTTYSIHYVHTDGATSSTGPAGTWTTGAIPATQHFPAITTPVPPSTETSRQDGIVFHDTIGSGMDTPQTMLFATDLQGNIVWYIPNGDYVSNGFTRPLPSGNILDQMYGASLEDEILRIMDPLGNPIRETSLARLNEQLGEQFGAQYKIRAMHHDSTLLPNGHIIVIGYNERLFPPGTQDSRSGLPVDIVGDELIDLDKNLQVSWVWNTFDHLDVNRPALLGETCKAAAPGCVPSLQYGDQAGGIVQDWTHSNAITYSPTDHNLLLSIRHQDWIVKIDYQDGQGDGHVLWRLGHGGDMTLTNPQAGGDFPWFSHQHGIGVTDDGKLITFDNGNTRCKEGTVPNCHSRGQVYQLDQAHHQATLLVNADMGNYSLALGWAQFLQNGNYAFTSGLQRVAPPAFGQSEEFDPSGARLVYAIQDEPAWLYRGYRMSSMYDGCCSVPAQLTIPTPTLTIQAQGPGTVSPVTGPYPLNTQVTLSATPAAGAALLRWQVDGQYRGWSPALTIALDQSHTVVAIFGTLPSFSDVTPSDPGYEAIRQLAAQGIIRGYQNGQFGPTDPVLRTQIAALIARSFGWQTEVHDNPFPDRCDPVNPADCVDAELWNDVGVLNDRNVARGYTDPLACSAAGTVAPCYLPRVAVLHAQAISFITRAMEAAGYWQAVTTDDGSYRNVPASSGHRQDLLTFIHYAGSIPDRPTDQGWTDWATPASRDWTARILWQALNQQFGR